MRLVVNRRPIRRPDRGHRVALAAALAESAARVLSACSASTSTGNGNTATRDVADQLRDLTLDRPNHLLTLDRPNHLDTIGVAERGCRERGAGARLAVGR